MSRLNVTRMFWDEPEPEEAYVDTAPPATEAEKAAWAAAYEAKAAQVVPW